MTRRERHIRIIESWGINSHLAIFYRQELLSQRGLGAFTDEAVRELATKLVKGRARQNRINEQNRKLRQEAAHV